VGVVEDSYFLAAVCSLNKYMRLTEWDDRRLSFSVTVVYTIVQRPVLNLRRRRRRDKTAEFRHVVGVFESVTVCDSFLIVSGLEAGRRRHAKCRHFELAEPTGVLSLRLFKIPADYRRRDETWDFGRVSSAVLTGHNVNEVRWWGHLSQLISLWRCCLYSTQLDSLRALARPVYGVARLRWVKINRKMVHFFS